MDMGGNKQRGVSLTGLLMGSVVVILVALLSLKLVPAYVHNSQIAQIFQAMAADPALAGASIRDIKDSYFKRAMVNDIKDITAEDIEIENDNGVLSLSASYSVKIPLFGNITLVLDFNPSSS